MRFMRRRPEPEPAVVEGSGAELAAMLATLPAGTQATMDGPLVGSMIPETGAEFTLTVSDGTGRSATASGTDKVAVLRAAIDAYHATPAVG